MYQTFLNDARKVNPNVRLIGLTATPYRMKSGMLCGPDSLLNHICYEVGVKELIVQGFLSPLVSKASRSKIDTSDLHVRGGEFVASETETLMDTDELVEAACKEILNYTRERKSVLIFSAGVNHGEHIADTLRRKTNQTIGTVFGDTLDFERDQTIEDFRAGRLKFLVNMNVLTTGFDAPNVDCVALLRPTLSPGLYSQMVGRGCRLSPGKTNCLILDFGGNILRHGPIDAVRIQKEEGRGNGGEPVAKECPQCQSVIAVGYSACPDCGFEFPQPEEKKHEAEASDEHILSGQITTTDYEVRGIDYAVHHKRGAPEDAPRTLRVDYRIGLWSYQSEYVCFEHNGYARSKSESWWRQRSNAPIPDTAAEAVDLAEAGALAKASQIRVRSVSGEKYDRIIGYELGDKPPWREPGWDEAEESDSEVSWANLDEVPF